MAALKVITAAAASGDYELSDDDDEGPRSALGRLIAAGFSDGKEDRRDVFDGKYANPWRDGPVARFRKRYKLT